jgi:NAD(P)H-hydrate epimerase
MRLINVAEMKELEKSADAAGYTYAEMMKTAGAGVAEFIITRYQAEDCTTVIGLAGGGNNGGDTLIALTTLQQRGWRTGVLLLKTRKKSDPVLVDYFSSGGKEILISDLPGLNNECDERGIVLDGVFGTGFHPPLSEDMVNALAAVRKELNSFTWIAVDCPSGVDCETGEVSPGTVKADLCICLEAVKNGMLTYDSFPYCGELVTVELGISRYSSQAEKPVDVVVDANLVKNLLPIRSDVSHKGSFGKVLIVGGSVNYPGAPVLAGKGAYAVGTGLVQVAIPESIYSAASASNLELTWLILEDGGGVISEIAVNTVHPHLQKAQSLVLGPGIGREETTRRFINNLVFGSSERSKGGAGFPGMDREIPGNHSIASSLQVVIDADALFLLAKEKDWAERLQVNAVLTPHPGEMTVLTGLKVEEIQQNRMEIARKYACQWKQTLVLKGPLTVVADPSGRIAVIPIATSSLAKAGTGDVLAGMIGGLIAQGVDPWNAAVAGAWLHARAGILAARRIGCTESVLAGDIARAVPEVYQSI